MAPGPLGEAAQVVLLTLDGLGWRQLQDRLRTAPVLAGLEGGPISSVAPTTTAAALTSLTMGMPPAEHGIVGYKFAVTGPTGTEVLNVLRWSTRSGDARPFVPPDRPSPGRLSTAARCPSSAGRTSPAAASAKLTNGGRER